MMNGNGCELEELPIVAVRTRRSGDLQPATRGHGWPADSATEQANDSLIKALDAVAEAADLSDAERGERIGTLVVESESRVIRSWRLCGEDTEAEK